MYKVELKVIENLECFLEKLFQGISVEKYSWCELGWTELYIVIDDKYEPFFVDEHMPGSEFISKISKPVFPVMVHIGAFKSLNDFTTIESTKDFLKSKCELILVITDCVYVDVYIKNKTDAYMIFYNISNITENASITKIDGDCSQIVF